jgi:hypothetical protein
MAASLVGIQRLPHALHLSSSSFCIFSVSSSITQTHHSYQKICFREVACHD